MAAKGHPKRSFNAITQAGLKAYNLAVAHRALLEPRLEPDTLSALSAALESLGAEVPGVERVRQEAKTATAAQAEALSRAYALITAIRLCASRRAPSVDIKRAYGVGSRCDSRLVRDVKAAAQQILARAEERAEEAAELGILPKDLEALRAHLAELTAIDQRQELKRATSPAATRARDATARRILRAIDHIVAAGVLEFAEDREARSEFERLIGAGRPREKKKAAAAAGEGAAPTALPLPRLVPPST